MTEEELAEIEARAAAVSANLFTPDALHAESLTILWLYDNFDIGVEPDDGAFLIHARSDVLALIAEVRRREEGAVQVGKMVARLNTEMNELQAENEKLHAVLTSISKLVPLIDDWEPYDEWGDINGYPEFDPDGNVRFCGVDSTNSGDVRCAGVFAGCRMAGLIARDALDEIREGRE